MIKFKKIKVHPSNWELDIIISKNHNQVCAFCQKKYGYDEDYKKDFPPETCLTLTSSSESETKGRRITIIYLKAKKSSVVVHELVHAMWHITNNIGYEMNYDTNEWQAVLFEYLFEQVMANDYQQIPTTKKA